MVAGAFGVQAMGYRKAEAGFAVIEGGVDRHGGGARLCRRHGAGERRRKRRDAARHLIDIDRIMAVDAGGHVGDAPAASSDFPLKQCRRVDWRSNSSPAPPNCNR